MPDLDEPDETQLARLPSLALVAFAARCARRVQPLYRPTFDVYDPPKQLGAVDYAIAAAEVHGSTIPTKEVVSRSVAAGAVKGAYIAAERGLFADAIYAATAAAYAARMVRWFPDNLHVRVMTTAFNVAHQSALAATASEQNGNIGAESAVLTAVKHDYGLLLNAAAAESWTDETPVPPEFFGPLWPFGPPPNWPVKEEDSDGAELVLEIEVPDDATDEEIALPTPIRIWSVASQFGGRGSYWPSFL